MIEGAIDEDSSVTFASLGLCQPLVDACKALKWKKPSKIQQEAIPVSLEGKDVIGLAQTGSGKTAAFALPILHSLIENPTPLYAVVLAPTRELAFQISEQFEALGSLVGVRTCVIVGGVDSVTQAIALARKPHIIIATPGRLVEHLEKTKGFNLKTCKFLVLDEADRMLQANFNSELEKVLDCLPREGRRTMLFSATMTSKVEKLQRACLKEPVKVEVAGKYQTVDTLVQHYVFAPAKFKDLYLTYILNELSGVTAMIFVSTCYAAYKVALMLRNLGFGALPLHGQMPQPKRLTALAKFKAGQRNILVATDVASRGLDIPAVDVVINYDIPPKSKDYVHRVGRTARAGRAGRAVNIVTQYDVELFQKIEEMIEKKMDAMPMSTEEVMVLQERVAESLRLATMELKEKGWSQTGGAPGGKAAAEAEAEDDGAGPSGEAGPSREGGGKKRKPSNKEYLSTKRADRKKR